MFCKSAQEGGQHYAYEWIEKEQRIAWFTEVRLVVNERAEPWFVVVERRQTAIDEQPIPHLEPQP
jgi:hypothetical protein